jgi:deazaflavin-dependent oxidoreductase (nitroreductase family)
MGLNERAAVAIAGTRPGAWFFVNVASRLDRILVPLTRGRLSSCLGTQYHGRHLLLLTTAGARSGRRRTAPLLYVVDGERLVVIGSRGGHSRHPAWYHNLRASPRATVYARGTIGEYVAREAQGEERARLWARAVELYPGYAAYREAAGPRKIPVIVLTPLHRADRDDA